MSQWGLLNTDSLKKLEFLHNGLEKLSPEIVQLQLTLICGFAVSLDYPTVIGYVFKQHMTRKWLKLLWPNN